MVTLPCPHCGALIGQDRADGRCAACGSPLPQPPGGSAQRSKCDVCGREIPGNAPLCPFCSANPITEARRVDRLGQACKCSRCAGLGSCKSCNGTGKEVLYGPE